MKRAIVACTRRLSSSGTVLGLHSITSPELPSDEIVHMPADVFEVIVDASRSLGELVPLHELIRRHQAGRSTANLIAITFDDAYASLCFIADYIERHQVPVTVFPVVAALDAAQPFWWDRIGDLAKHVSAEQWAGLERSYGIPLSEAAPWGDSSLRHRSVRRWILSRYSGRWAESLNQPLASLEQATGVRTLHRPMNWEELGRFLAISTVDIGVHTISHPVLPLLSDLSLVAEVSDAHNILRERFSRTVPILAMPFGLFDDRTVRLAYEAGMTAALSIANQTLRSYSATSEIPRFCLTRKETALKLALRVGGVLDTVRRWQGSLERYPLLPTVHEQPAA